jgi:hypothetical protein
MRVQPTFSALADNFDNLPWFALPKFGSLRHSLGMIVIGVDGGSLFRQTRRLSGHSSGAIAIRCMVELVGRAAWRNPEDVKRRFPGRAF